MRRICTIAVASISSLVFVVSPVVDGAVPDLNQHGLTGSWYDPAKGGQGIELEVFPDLVAPGTSLVQGALFTFDSAPVDGSERERWYTFNGNGQSGSIPVTIYQNVGGNFDAPPITQPTAIGSGTLAFSDCSNGMLNYAVSDGSSRSGSTPLTRLTPNVTCTSDGSAATDSEPSGPGLRMTTKTAQSFVDQATGASVVIPPGIYSGGLRLNRPLTVNLRGVVLTGVVDGKGFVLVDNTPGPVVIEDFETLLPPGEGTNAAGIRIQGGGDVTVRRAHIANSEMGILSGNEGTGKLTIDDSVIEGMYGGSDLSHGIYAGFSDTLTVRRTTVRDVKGLGHLVKSRAKATNIEQSYLLGLNGRDSREFEAPNGGHVSITHSVIQKGANTDNAEFTMVGGEIAQADPAMAYLPSSFTFTDNWVIFDRKQVAPEPAWQAGPNNFGKYRNMPPTWLNVPAPPAPVIQRSKFVNMTNPGEFPPFDSSNTFFPTRAAAGLGPTSIPAIP